MKKITFIALLLSSLFLNVNHQALRADEPPSVDCVNNACSIDWLCGNCAYPASFGYGGELGYVEFWCHSNGTGFCCGVGYGYCYHICLGYGCIADKSIACVLCNCNWAGC
jgi:hypothetical protein